MWQPQSFYNEYLLGSPVILNGDKSIRGLFNFPSERIAVIHGKTFNDFELFKSSFKKKDLVFFERSWKGEPDFCGLKNSLNQINVFKPDTFISVGGGSVIDGVKICRLLYELPYYSIGEKFDGSLLKTRFIAVPTTIGSGSEISSAAVYLEDNHKQMIVSHYLQPDVIVYDKRYVENTPKNIMCMSVLDAISHIVEGYTSKIDNDIASIMAEEGLRLLRVEVTNLISNKENDFERLQYAGYIGGIVQNHCIVGAAHGIAHQLTNYGFSHGEAVGLLLSSVIKMNMKDEKTGAKYNALLENAGFSGVEELIELIGILCEKAGISKRKQEIKELLISKENDADFLANIRDDKGGKGNPIDMSDNYLKELFRSI